MGDRAGLSADQDSGEDQGIAPPIVAVNISAAQFKLASDLDRIVAESLAKYGVAPCALELELTESVLMETTQKHKKPSNDCGGSGCGSPSTTSEPDIRR